MALTVTTTTPIFLGFLAAQGNLGVSAPRLALGLSRGLSNYAGTSLRVLSADVGTLGVGAGTGAGMFMPQPAAVSAMIASFQSHSISGVASIPNAIAIAQGMCACLAQSTIQTVSPSVGSGTGTATLLPGADAVSIFIQAFLTSGLQGIQSANIASAVAQGFNAVAPLCKSPIAIVGAPNVSPSSGSGFGKLI